MNNLTPNEPEQPQVDFSAAEATSTATIAPANGTHLVRIAGFEPRVNAESGTVQAWVFTLDAAENIPDNQKPPQEIPEGSRLGTFSTFMAPSQFTSLQDCIADAKKSSQALNNIVRDIRKDPGMKNADSAWNALPAQQKRPMFTGTPPMMDADLEWYSQWVGAVVLATLNTKVGKDGVERTNLIGLAAKDSVRVIKGAKK